MLDQKDDARAAKRAAHHLRKQYRLLQQLQFEGVVEITVRSADRSLTVPVGVLTAGAVVQELAGELYQRYWQARQAEQDLLSDWLGEEALSTSKKTHNG